MAARRRAWSWWNTVRRLMSALAFENARIAKAYLQKARVSFRA
jgi:hypothetical protein